jgi:hypothetical protein
VSAGGLALLVGAAAGLAGAAGAQGRLPTVRPPDAIDRAQGMATRRPASIPPLPAAEERWVPERRRYSPQLGTVVVPGHYERRISDQQYWVPNLNATTPGGRSIPIPAGEHPPADLRNAP